MRPSAAGSAPVSQDSSWHLSAPPPEAGERDKASPGLRGILPAAFNKYAMSRGRKIDEVL